MSTDTPTEWMHRSPDEQHAVEFRLAGEVQMGAPYFHAIVDDECLGNRIFGDKCVWSPDGRYVALEQWLNTDRSKGPETQLLVIDICQRTECTLGRGKGFVTPLTFNDRSIVFRGVAHAIPDDQQTHALPACKKWQPLEVGEADRPWEGRLSVLDALLCLFVVGLPYLFCLVVLGAIAYMVWRLLR